MKLDPTKKLVPSAKVVPVQQKSSEKPASATEAAAAPTPPADKFEGKSLVKVFPQDPLVGETENIELPKSIIGDRLSSPRIRTRDRAPIAMADIDGNYDYEVGTPQFDQANAHALVANTLFMYDNYLGTEAQWSFRGPLNVVPHKGQGKTAYFSRYDRSINFFEWDSPSLGKRVTTAQSADVIAHEIGHAIWDGLRPRNGYSNEAGAFHEAFGDASAMLHSLQQESNITKALEQNGGDLTKPSLISRMAEEFGVGFNKEDSNPDNDDRMYYRTAINEFKYIDPKKLPDDDYPPTVGEEVLTREFHSFSRVWSGAFYRMLTALYDGKREDGADPKEALVSARDTLGHTWGKALTELPPTGTKFATVSQAMLQQASRSGDLVTFDRLAGVIVDRNLLDQNQVDGLRTATVPDVKVGDGKPETVLAQMTKALDLPEGYTSEGEAQTLKDGRTIYQFTKGERHQLPGLNHLGDKLEMDLHSGLSATFDESGQLVSFFHTPIGDSEREDAEIFAKGLMKNDRVKTDPLSAKAESGDGRVFLGRLLPDRPGVTVLERLPVFD